jgi:hypothetical protein
MFTLQQLLGSTFTPQMLFLSTILAVLLCGAKRIRRMVIWIAQFALLFGLMFSTLAAGKAGYEFGMTAAQADQSGTYARFYPFLGAGAGGFIAFAAGALVSSFFFLLHEIADNTRKTP